MRNFKFSVVLATLSLFMGFAHRAACKMALPDDYMISENIYRSIALRNYTDNMVLLNFIKQGNGAISNAYVEKSNLDIVTEAAVLEALYASVKEISTTAPHRMLLHINNQNEFIKPDRSIAAFGKTHSELRHAAVVHLIPVAFIDQFGIEELRSVSNLASLGVNKKTALLKLRNIYAEWRPMLLSPKSFSRAQILEQARGIKSKYKLREGKLPPEAISH